MRHMTNTTVVVGSHRAMAKSCVVFAEGFEMRNLKKREYNKITGDASVVNSRYYLAATFSKFRRGADH